MLTLDQQVKYCTNGEVRNRQTWSDKNGSHVKKYIESDFDYYAMYLKPIDKVIYVHIKYGGKTIRWEDPKNSGDYFWYEDFLEFNENVEKRKITTNFIRRGSNETFTRFKQPDKIDWPSKEELEKLLWEKPTATLAKELSVTDSAIGKKCKKLGIKKPPRGYWAKEYSNG